jgi:hypothetical protein
MFWAGLSCKFRVNTERKRVGTTPPMSAPGGLARRFWSDASANHMSVTSLRDHSPPNRMARHRTLRRATVSASAKMPRTWAHTAGFLTKKVCLFMILPLVVYRTFVVAKKISPVCQHRQALPGNVIDSDAESGRFSVSRSGGKSNR